jgi:hypothetical protein
MGRYLESDPIGLLGGLSTFGYVRSNPLGWIDLRGLECKPVLTGPYVADGQYHDKEQNSDIFLFLTSTVTGGSPGFGADLGTEGLGICGEIKIRLMIYKVHYVHDEYDLYEKWKHEVTYRCEEAGCPLPRVTYNTQWEQGEPRFIKHVSVRKVQWDPWKEWEAPGPTPACLPGVGGPDRDD